MDSNSGPSAYQHNALPLGQTGSQHSMAKPTHSPQLCHTLYALIIQNIFACRTCLDGAAVLGTRFPMYQSLLLPHSCFTATETIQTIRDTVARTPTSSFTQLLSSACGRVRVQCVALRSQRPCVLLGTGARGRPPVLSHSCRALTRVVC